MVFLCVFLVFPWFPYGFPMVSLIFLKVSHGFPMVFLKLVHGFHHARHGQRLRWHSRAAGNGIATGIAAVRGHERHGIEGHEGHGSGVRFWTIQGSTPVR